MLYSVYCQLSHSMAVVWDVTHSLAIALSVSVLPSCENVVFQLPFCAWYGTQDEGAQPDVSS